MIKPPSLLSRRHLLAGLTGAVVAVGSRQTAAQTPQPFEVAIKEGASGACVFDPMPPAVFRLGDKLRLAITNTLPARIALGVSGLDGAALEPLLKQAPLEAGKTTTIDLPLTQAGTFTLDTRLLADGLSKPLPIAAFVVAEAAPPQVDQDRILLIEDARMRSDGGFVAPGVGAGDARTVYRVNGQPDFDLQVRQNERLRLRLVNGCHRNAVALQFEDHDVRVIAIDSRPAEPFLARERRVVLAPGMRMDVLVDARQASGSTSRVQLFDGTGPKRVGQLSYSGAPLRAEPLPPATPPSDLPTRLELASAIRAQLDIGSADWPLAKDLVENRPAPLFRAKRGRTVLLTLTNRATSPTTFHLHGHHFRWLDRLDDGWKPFLQDTMLVDVGQTDRIAFVAEHAGEWLIETMAMIWTAPKRIHWFAVD